MTINTYATLKTAVDAYGKWAGAHDTLIPDWISLSEDWNAKNLRVRDMEKRIQIVVQKFAGIDATGLGGTANALTITNDTATSSYTRGEAYKITAEADNSGNMTVDVDSKGAKSILESDGSTEVSSGDFITGSAYYISYDGTQFRLVPPGGFALPSRFEEFKRLYIPGTPNWRLGVKTPDTFWIKYESGVVKPKTFTIEGDLIIFGPAAPDSKYFIEGVYFKRYADMSADADTNWILTNARGILLYGALVEGYTYLNDTANVLKYTGLRDSLVDNVQEADKSSRYDGATPESDSAVSVD